jgi:hypothetical protein
MEAGKPKGWILMPKLQSLPSAYLFEDLQQWVWPLHRVFGVAATKLLHASEAVMLVPLLLIAFLLLSAPVVLFVLSHLVAPVFTHRYFLPSGIGLVIILVDLANELGADCSQRYRLYWLALILLLAASPVISALGLPPIELSPQYLDVSHLDSLVPPGIPVVVGWQEDFAKVMRFSNRAERPYFFLLDWPTALIGPTGFVLDYHLMRAYRENGYYSSNIEESKTFLCSHPDFLVLDADGRSWFDIAIKGLPQFQWGVVAYLNTPDPPRRLITVHRRSTLPFCSNLF